VQRSGSATNAEGLIKGRRLTAPTCCQKKKRIGCDVRSAEGLKEGIGCCMPMERGNRYGPMPMERVVGDVHEIDGDRSPRNDTSRHDLIDADERATWVAVDSAKKSTSRQEEDGDTIGKEVR